MRTEVRRFGIGLGSLVALVLAAPSNAAVIRADITLTTQQTDFSDVIFTFTNLSTPGYQITGERFTGAFIDWVGGTALGNYPMVLPSGGTATPINGTQVVNSGNPDDGCAGPDFSLTGFDSGESFSFYADPENNACQSFVYDFRQRLSASSVTGFVTFTGPLIAGSVELSGNNWVKELINPAGNDVALNQRYRLTLMRTIDDPTSVPEPASLALFAAGLAGLAAVRRRRVAQG